jgi:drug/metabolite transporter (DMT)-like permease
MMDREQKLTARKWLGLILGLIGVGWLVGASLSFDSQGFLWGCLGCLASALAWAVGSLRARGASPHVSPVSRAAMQMVCAGSMLLAMSLYSQEQSGLAEVTNSAWWSLTYLTLFGSLVAYSAYTWLVANVSAAVVATHAYVNPVVAVLLGSLLGGEVLTPETGLAAAVAMLGVVVLMLPERPALVPALALVEDPGSDRRLYPGPGRHRRTIHRRAS